MNRLMMLVFVALLASCGGGGGSDGGRNGDHNENTQSGHMPSAGIYQGQTANGLDLLGYIQNDGTYYVVYLPGRGELLTAGIIQGSMNAASGVFSSSNARNFVLYENQVMTANVSGSYISRQYLNGTIRYPGQALDNQFTATFNAMQSDSRNTLADMAGSYTGMTSTLVGFADSIVNINASGTVSAISGNCLLQGSVSPKPNENIFELHASFTGSDCLYPNQSIAGMAFLNKTSGGLIAILITPNRAGAVLFMGLKS